MNERMNERTINCTIPSATTGMKDAMIPGASLSTLAQQTTGFPTESVSNTQWSARAVVVRKTGVVKSSTGYLSSSAVALPTMTLLKWTCFPCPAVIVMLAPGLLPVVSQRSLGARRNGRGAELVPL